MLVKATVMNHMIIDVGICKKLRNNQECQELVIKDLLEYSKIRNVIVTNIQGTKL